MQLEVDEAVCGAVVPFAQRGAPATGKATAAPAAFKKSERFMRPKVEIIQPVARTLPIPEMRVQRTRVASSRSNKPGRKGSFI